MKNIKIISLLSCTAIFLLTMAIMTVGQTFSIEDDTTNFDIKLSTENKNTIIKGTKLDFYNTISLGDTYSFDINVSNVGNVDAELRKVILANLSNYKVATSSKTNKTYTLDDYLIYNVYYSSENKDNDVSANDKVKAYDLLKKNTTNTIKVEVKYDEKNVSEDEKIALEETTGDTKINLSLYLNLDYTNK